MSALTENTVYSELPCKTGYVHVYLSRWDNIRDTDMHALDEEEMARAKAFLYPADRRRYCGAHIFLRTILSQYTHTEPYAIRFESSPHYGKPLLRDQGHIHFNLSYRGEWAVLAVSDKVIGADIEKHIQIEDMEQFAKNFFSEKERLWLLRTQAPDLRLQNFFRLWALKEAYIKAIGKGLSFPLQEFSILLENEKPTLELPYGNNENWVFAEIKAPEGYAAAVCYKP